MGQDWWNHHQQGSSLGIAHMKPKWLCPKLGDTWQTYSQPWALGFLFPNKPVHQSEPKSGLSKKGWYTVYGIPQLPQVEQHIPGEQMQLHGQEKSHSQAPSSCPSLSWSPEWNCQACTAANSCPKIIWAESHYSSYSSSMFQCYIIPL